MECEDFIMGWFDRIKQVPWHAGALFLEYARDLRVHYDEKQRERVSWLQERRQEHQRLSQDRVNAQQQIAQLKDFQQFRGMTPLQRSTQIAQTAGQMPGWLQVQHARPLVHFLSGIVRVPFRALRGGAAAAARITPGSNSFLIFLALLYHFYIFAVDPSLLTRLWINFALILLVIFLIFDSSERNGDTYRTLFLFVFILEIFIPYLTTRFAILQQFDFVRLYLANNFIILTWLYYAVFIRGRNITLGLTNWWRIFIILFWLGVVFSFIGTSLVDFSDVELDTAGVQQWYAAKQIALKAVEGWSMLWQGITGGFSNIGEIWEMRMKQASGEYYYGVVEENEKEPLGVYLEDLKASQKEFEENEQVTVFATLKAKTLDDTININISCFAGTDKNKITGSVYPDDSFEIATLAQEELDCSFDKLPEGTNKITYTADFNFETIGYLKRYFADRDAIIAANRQGIDLLDEYQITDKEPVAHYTNGPVSLGMGPGVALIGISESYAVKPRLAVTLDSSTKGWGGVIKEIDELVLIMPEEMTLDTSQCTDPDWTEYTFDDCVQSELQYKSKMSQDCNEDEGCIEEQCTTQLEGYHAYALDTDKPEYKDIKDFMTMSCRLNVDDIVGLLGATPLATHYFYVKTRYDYEVSEDTSVVVKEAEGAVSLPGETVSGKTTATEVPTFGSGDDEKELQYIFYNYGDFLFAAQEKFDVPVCAVASIIAHTSSADPNYYKDKQKGLLGIPDTVAAQFASAAGEAGSHNLYNAETNINIGAAYMKDLLESLGAYSSDFGKTYYVFMQGQAGNTISNEDAELFGAYFFSTAKKCGEMGLKYTQQATEIGPELLQGSVAYSGITEASPVEIYIAGTAPKLLILNFTKEEITTEPPFTQTFFIATLFYNGAEIDSHSVSIENMAGSFDQWLSFEQYPLLEVLFNSTGQEVAYRTFSDFVVTPAPLLEETPTAILEDTDPFFVEYTSSAFTSSSIEFKLANNPEDAEDLDTICTLSWYDYISYATCEEDDLPGLIARNINTGESTQGKFARIQIEWNTQKQLEGLKS